MHCTKYLSKNKNTHEVLLLLNESFGVVLVVVPQHTLRVRWRAGHIR